jgi:phosphatidylglycerophosphate synthase
MKYNWNVFKTNEDKKIKKYDIVDKSIHKFITYPILPTLVQLNLTPNFITTISLICGIISFVLISYDNYICGSVFFMLRYIADCLDGPVARLTKQTSEFGDIYDHCVDYFTFILFYISCYTKNFSNIFIIILHILLFSSLIQYALIYRKTKTGIIYKLTSWIPIDENMFKWTKYIGTGILTLFCTIGIFLHK